MGKASIDTFSIHTLPVSLTHKASSPSQIPIIGNHESEADGDGDAIAGRYLNQTFGLPYGNPLATSRSSATSGLGHLLTKGTYLAPGLHGTTPSGSSAYFSVDVGLIHITALSTQKPAGDELAWLTKDLEAANKNRQQVPWIIVTSHYPIFLSTAQATSVNSSASALGWHSEAGEVCSDGICAGTEYMSCETAGEAAGCATVGEMVEESSNSMGALFNRYGVVCPRATSPLSCVLALTLRMRRTCTTQAIRICTL